VKNQVFGHGNETIHRKVWLKLIDMLSKVQADAWTIGALATGEIPSESLNYSVKLK